MLVKRSCSDGCSHAHTTDSSCQHKMECVITTHQSLLLGVWMKTVAWRWRKGWWSWERHTWDQTWRWPAPSTEHPHYMCTNINMNVCTCSWCVVSNSVWLAGTSADVCKVKEVWYNCNTFYSNTLLSQIENRHPFTQHTYKHWQVSWDHQSHLAPAINHAHSSAPGGEERGG